MKFGITQFNKETPECMKKVGGALVAAGAAGAAATVIPGISPYITVIAVVGAFLTKFFGEDSKEDKSNL